jgi:two-component system CheB/CheR fusion protein
VNLADLVRIVVETARVRADRHVMTLDAPDLLEIVADPLRIEQVLTNLVDNAVKYSPAGTSIDVSVTASPESVEIVVRDHGIGIPREHQQRIFDRFFQVDVGGHTSGMGLGLYISREIVQGHGGTIRAELPDDGGTRMVVTLPRQVIQETRVPAPSVPSSQRSA